ncbi:MAG: cation-translocating P-type ATPase [Endomicrobiales bacterium]
MALEFDVHALTGLSEEEAAARLREEGYNELPSARRRSGLKIAREVLSEPIFLLLVAGGLIYFFLGDFQEALMLLGFVFVIMGITIYQERKTEHALETLKDLTSPRALVVRDGEQKRIPGREVARGDILLLAEGDRVPADAVLLSCVNFSADEALLTGESVPVRKRPAKGGEEALQRPGGDDLPFVYSGTLVVQGRGVARVKETGAHTEIGKIGKALRSLEPGRTRLQKETQRLVRNLAFAGGFLCVLVIVLYGYTRHDWLNGFLAGITLAMATLPEEFPVVLTVFLALGAWRMSQKQVLTRRVPAIETLGSATVLCVDKTGTLTQNRMSVGVLAVDGQSFGIEETLPPSLPEKFHEIVEFSILASQRDPFDPMEKAIKALGEKALAHTEHIHHNWTLMKEYPLDPELLAMSRVWKSPDGQDYIIASKGAPEAIIDLCHLDADEAKARLAAVRGMAARGLRVLGVAKAAFRQASLPGEQHAFTFRLIGFLGLEDPLRPTVPGAIRECYRAGMRVIMITGDYPDTARNIARKIGLQGPDDCITGPELEAMSDGELKERIRAVSIFARAVPEQKLRIVTALKENGEVVAMTGDGVNDSPALKAADIGIAMGMRGTDVAREAASLVLVDDDFSSIVRAVKMGRRIYDNLKKAMAYIFAIHVPIAGMSLLPVVLHGPLVLLPVHIVFLELIIDPACSIVFEAEPEEPNVMRQPPRALKEPLFGRRTVLFSLFQGLGVLLITFTAYYAALWLGRGALEARTFTFVTLIFANLGLILTNRSLSVSFIKTLTTRNTALWLVLSGAVIFLGLVLYVPVLRQLFRFSVMHPVDVAICLAGALVTILGSEGLKLVYERNPREVAATVR